jgi:photosystem II stability/assembly factor-like uncharacterized protein
MRLRTHAGASLLALLWLARPATSEANGALPSTTQVLLPPSPSPAIIVTTTFGLISSDDGGASWRWMCEHGEASGGNFYQLAGPRLFTIGTGGLVVSDDRACRWTVAIDRSGPMVFDYFVDPSDPGRVLVLATMTDGRSAILELTAATRILYTAPPGEELRTVEIARSNPRIIYATSAPANGSGAARLARSDDGGASWTVFTPEPAVPTLGIIAIHPGDPQRLHFRVVTDAGDALVVTSDGGKTVHTALAAGRVLSSFVRLANGHLLVGWLDLDQGLLFRSTDDGASFAPLPPALHPRSLAERDGRVYAATDWLTDGYALAVSEDEGTRWKRVMAFSDVTGPACPGAGATCNASCRDLVARNVFGSAVCGWSPADGGDGAGPTDGAAGIDAAATEAGPVAPAGDRHGDGCSCGLAGRTDPDSRGALPKVFAIVFMAALYVRKAGRNA